MRIPVLCALPLGLSVFMFLTSLGCLLIQPDLSVMAPVWQWALLASAVLLPLAFIFRRCDSEHKLWLMLPTDLFLFLILALTFTGVLYPGYVLKISGLGASFSYNLIFSALVLLASVIVFRESINIIYCYSKKGQEILVFTAIRLSAVFAILLLGGILFLIISKGIWAINWQFLTEPHRRLGQSGGIWTCIEGTFWLTLGAMLFSAPLGIGAAIYMNEYSKHSGFKRAITVAVGVLNGVPSIVYGLFGLALLVTIFGVSLLSGSIILGIMNLPTIILTSQEALKSVPNSLREGSLALGATRWQTISRVVFPASLPGILTGLIIGLARAAGETAPIMWTAVTFSATPVSKVYGVIPDVFQPVNSLGYHLLNLIYFLGAWDVEANAWGTALVLLVLVLGINMAAILVRNHYRKKISW